MEEAENICDNVIMINKGQVIETGTPDEIKRYQKIIANRDAIINDAETKAQTIIAQAEEKQIQQI